LKWHFDEESMTRFRPAQKACRRPESRQIEAAMLTASAQQCGMAETGEAIAVSWRAPMADKSNDPVAIWQNMIGEMEKGFNSFANQAMTSPEFSKAVNQVGGVVAGAQKQLGDLMEKYLVSMNLPSRAQMVGMAERLQSIEGQLNEIKALLHQVHNNSGTPEGGYGAVPRPPRTKRPPGAGGEQK
jgi:hypothetical protein